MRASSHWRRPARMGGADCARRPRDVRHGQRDGHLDVFHHDDSFYVVGFGWTAVCRIKPGDVLKGRGDELLTVDRVVRTDRAETVYTVSIEPSRTFFVGCQEWGFAVWVHNRACTSVLENKLTLANRARVAATDQIAHIVPLGKFSGRDAAVRKAIQNAKGVLRRAKIKLDEVDNLFWANNRRHSGTHTDDYFKWLAGYLKSAEKGGTVRAQLKQLAADLQSGLIDFLSS